MTRPFAVIKGDKPLDAAELTARIADALNAQMSPMVREELSLTRPDVAKGLASALSAQRNQSIDNNAFNHRLMAYRAARRLKSKKRRRLPAKVKITILDEKTGKAKTKSVKNPELEKDDAARAYADAVIKNTPDDVKAFDK